MLKNYWKIILFFFNIPEQNIVLLSITENNIICSKVITLNSICVTHWIKRYEEVHCFIRFFEYTVDAFECISDWKDSSVTDALLLLKLVDSKFIISAHVV